VFSAAGLGADRGAATAVAYGVMVLAASLPGGLVLLVGSLLRRHAANPPVGMSSETEHVSGGNDHVIPLSSHPR
jgi:hypothetical protein